MTSQEHNSAAVKCWTEQLNKVCKTSWSTGALETVATMIIDMDFIGTTDLVGAQAITAYKSATPRQLGLINRLIAKKQTARRRHIRRARR